MHSYLEVEDVSGLKASAELAKWVVYAFGICASAGLLAYGLVYIFAMPAVTPEMLISGSFGTLHIGPAAIAIQMWAVVIYAFASLPLNVMFTIRQYRASPVGMVMAACLTCLALTMQITNGLPGLAMYLYPAKLIPPPADMPAYLAQANWIRFASLDVAAFTMLFVAGLIYAAVFWRTHRVLALVLVGSVVVFLLHLPVLWIAPRMAVAMMGLSVCIPACAPLIYSKMAVE